MDRQQLRSLIMDAKDNQIAGCKDSIAQIMKGKRTKRQRVPSPLRLGPLGMAYSSTSSSGGRTSDCYDSCTGYDRATTSTVATSDEFREKSTEEEEDMANCLILLAQGQRSTQRNRKVSEITGTTAIISTAGMKKKDAAAAGMYAYQCKTCNKCFPSFQALGGHRTSHKKQKTMMNTDQEKQSAGSGSLIDQENDIYSDTTTITNLSLRMSNGVLFSSANSNNKQKLHECSLCGAVFSSGQALGGHMRRHRSFVSNTCTTSTTAGGMSVSEYTETSKDRNMLNLDLNLPAPEEDHRDKKFTFQPKEQVLLLSATPLVDCPL